MARFRLPVSSFRIRHQVVRRRRHSLLPSSSPSSMRSLRLVLRQSGCPSLHPTRSLGTLRLRIGLANIDIRHRASVVFARSATLPHKRRELFDNNCVDITTGTCNAIVCMLRELPDCFFKGEKVVDPSTWRCLRSPTRGE
ncbi:hypothetical protein KC365_g124 [Hortaea werneckii]|nr:hypothetical protein KC365_g124 [Hortaea werneckii]